MQKKEAPPPAARSTHRPAATPAAAPTPSPPWEASTITARAASTRPVETASPRRVMRHREMRTVPPRMSRLVSCRAVSSPSSLGEVQGVKASR